jgi:hypothetical protein
MALSRKDFFPVRVEVGIDFTARKRRVDADEPHLLSKRTISKFFNVLAVHVLGLNDALAALVTPAFL